MTHKILNILKVVVILLPLVEIRAQVAKSPDSLNFCAQKKQDLNHCGMITLTTWASVNILSGTGYFISQPRRDQYFYAMNAAWGAVNLAIAIPGLLSKKKHYDSEIELRKDHLKTEKIFLINAFLDVVYIGGGVALKEVANNQSDKNYKAMFSGFGNSFIVQGSGLLLFDVSMYLANRKNRKKCLDHLLQNSQISFTGKGLKATFRF
jgi:hypothetical protein